MYADRSVCVLEIARQADCLTMSIFDSSELSSTIKHYSQLPVSLPQINRLCQEIIPILNEAGKRRQNDPDLLARMKKAGQFLWDHLLTGQVKNKLKAAQFKELIISLDEDLITIPWELLYDGNDFLCLKFNLGRLVRTRQQQRAVQYRCAGKVLKMLVLADPTADLKSAYQEGVLIKNQFDCHRDKVKIDFKSTDIDTVYVKKNLRDYDIVHFAGHCEYDGSNRQAGGWLLSDGRLTTQDILALGESHDLRLPGLVFSNACGSAKSVIGLMDNDYQEKTYSLAAAFLFSGVRHYIGTIWQVEDPVSLEFAKEFYSRLINGSSIGECMRLSRQHLFREYGPAAICWAGYILYGDPRHRWFNPEISLSVPAAKITKAIRKYKSRILKFSLAALIVGLCLYLYAAMPLRNPAAYVLFLKANKLFDKGSNSEAISLSRSIIKSDPLFLAAYPLLANSYQRLGEREDALKYYFDYALYSEKKKDKKNLAGAYIGIAWVYQLFGDYPKAFEFYNQAIALSRESKDRLNEAVGLRKLAVWYIDKEDYDKALELLTKSSEINRENQSDNKYRYNLACDYFDLGLVFANKDDFNAAREFYKKSRVILEQMNLKAELSDYYFNLGELFLFEKQYSKAKEYYSRGLEIDELQGNKPNIASDYDMLGELYMEMGNAAEAEKYFLDSAAISRQIKLLPELASAYYNLGLLNKAKDNSVTAKEYFRQAEEIYRRIGLPVYKEIRQELIGLDAG